MTGGALLTPNEHLGGKQLVLILHSAGAEGPRKGT